MINTNETDVFDIIRVFQQTVLKQKPSKKDMISEVRMMKYKVRPVVGDISMLDFRNTEFLEALWSLGKLDELFQNHFDSLSEAQQDVFFRLIDEMRFNFQNELNKANIQKMSVKDPQSMFEMEIYKESSRKAN